MRIAGAAAPRPCAPADTEVTAATSDAISRMARFMWSLLSVGGERRADDLLVVARVDVPVGVGGIQPADVHQLPPVLRRRSRLDQVGAADLLVALRTRLDDDQLAAIVVDEQAVAVADDDARRPARLLLGDRLRLPDPLAGAGAQAAELPV